MCLTKFTGLLKQSYNNNNSSNMNTIIWQIQKNVKLQAGYRQSNFFNK